jgi:hypothetical protein
MVLRRDSAPLGVLVYRVFTTHEQSNQRRSGGLGNSQEPSFSGEKQMKTPAAIAFEAKKPLEIIKAPTS